MSPGFTKWMGVAVTVVVLLLAAYLTFFSETHSGLLLEAENRQETTADTDTPVPPDLKSLTALYRTINLVQKRYIDATRIDSRAMLVSALRAIQGIVAKVIVREEGNELVVRLGNDVRRYALGDVTTPWILLQRAKEVFGFLESDLTEDDVDFQKVEYAAINGMLRTLDPHTVFLDPENYRDMKDKTQGKFGGLGIVIAIRDGALTVVSAMAGTPADLAGLKAGDRIVRIGEASTVNMTLNDAVTLLRGEPGTKVLVFVLRKGWEEPRTFDIERAIIKVDSLEPHLLDDRVGYVRIKDFQGNTAEDLKNRLAEWKPKGLRGLVLDLRGCPGGLLEAAVEVSDLFIKSGVIVTTAGQGPADRDVRRAHDDGDEPSYPLVVIVDNGSASASEILAGALKSHGRALLVGERTFGKGSVQVLYDFHDGSALKMTTAQYLTPGDVSIQSVGVIPHVELKPVRADKEMIDLKLDSGYREIDLDHHFEGARPAGAADRPERSLSYLWTPSTGAAGGDADAGVGAEGPLVDEDRPFQPDFAIDLGREAVLRLAKARMEMVDAAALAKTLDAEAEAEDRRLVEALAALGVDWQAGADTGPARAAVTARLEPAGPLAAGKQAVLRMAVTNQGPGTFHRLLATSRSDFRPLGDRELAFGKIDPGQTVERTLAFRVPKDELAEAADVAWSFEDANGKTADPVALRFEITPLPRPSFAYAYELVDIGKGNGDSRLQPGESARLVVDVENVGEGPAAKTYVTLKSLSGEGLFMTAGRQVLDAILPGERRRAIFAFDVKPGFAEPTARFALALAELDLRVYSEEKIALPVTRPLAVKPMGGNVTAAAPGTPILAAPDRDAAVVARLEPGVAVSAEATVGAFHRVRLDADRVGWVAAAAVRSAPLASETGPGIALNRPPSLVIEPVDLVVRSKSITVRGVARDDVRVRDVYIFVGEDKAFFLPNRDEKNPAVLAFTAELPLKLGVNYIMIVAEESAVFAGRETLVVRRDREDGMPFLEARAFGAEPEPLGVLPMKNEP